MAMTKSLPKIGFLYLDHVLRFFDKTNFKGWPDKIESVTYRWGKDKNRFIKEVKRKKIKVLIGNIPATAYETFREIAKALPKVQFIPSLDSQFANKSKENVTHFCKKYNLPIPQTHIFYEKDQAMTFLKHCDYPKIIKKSYGPSNYGGYFVHKVDSFEEALTLLSRKQYYPIYVQEFIPMQADIRVMLIGHKPVCAFWRRPPDGGWLTNTSQGGSMDYMNVPLAALDISVRASKSTNAQYWACDIALGIDGKFRILECATAFAAFPYVRDWIGQFLMWTLSKGQMKKPYIPSYNWEELGKIRASLLRTMRHITFGKYCPSYDNADSYDAIGPDTYSLLPTELKAGEEWPSEIWNFQDNYVAKVAEQRIRELPFEHKDVGLEDAQTCVEEDLPVMASLNKQQLMDFFDGVKGIGPKMTEAIFASLGVEGTAGSLLFDPSHFLQVKNLNQKKYNAIVEYWAVFRTRL
jgi:hypothetical protein